MSAFLTKESFNLEPYPHGERAFKEVVIPGFYTAPTENTHTVTLIIPFQ